LGTGAARYPSTGGTNPRQPFKLGALALPWLQGKNPYCSLWRHLLVASHGYTSNELYGYEYNSYGNNVSNAQGLATFVNNVKSRTGSSKVDIVQMPYLNNDGTTYYPNQLLVHFSDCAGMECV